MAGLRCLAYAQATRRFTFEVLRGCFRNPKSHPSDIDNVLLTLVPGVAEQRGWFLFLEGRTRVPAVRGPADPVRVSPGRHSIACDCFHSGASAGDSGAYRSSDGKRPFHLVLGRCCAWHREDTRDARDLLTICPLGGSVDCSHARTPEFVCDRFSTGRRAGRCQVSSQPAERFTHMSNAQLSVSTRSTLGSTAVGQRFLAVECRYVIDRGSGAPSQQGKRRFGIRIDDYWLPTALLELRDSQQEIYFVHRPLWDDIRAEFPKFLSPKLLVTVITRVGDLFLWPIRTPDEDGKSDRWITSSLDAAKIARDRWVRVSANMSAGHYQIVEARIKLPEPAWRPEPFSDLLRLAFRDRQIDSLEHPVLQKLAGCRMSWLKQFDQVWCVDFEFGAPDGGLPDVRCMVAREHHSGALVRLWADALNGMDRPPFDAGSRTLIVAYYASAEIGCYLQLGWPVPPRILASAEFRCLTNGRLVTSGNGLLGALAHFGLQCVDAAEKDEMRHLALRGGVYTDAERGVLLDYCQSDADSLQRLLLATEPCITAACPAVDTWPRPPGWNTSESR